jgi:integrase
MSLMVGTQYQFGSLRLRGRLRSPAIWELRYYDTEPDGGRKRYAVIVGDAEQYPTLTEARRAVQTLLLRINAESPRAEMRIPNLGVLLDRFIESELPERYSTRVSYLSKIRVHLRPRWGDYPLDRFKPMVIEQWLRELEFAPKTKAHIRSLMHLIFKCAERWCLIEMGRNPIALVRVKNGSKRQPRPPVLTVDEFCRLLAQFTEPFRTMVLIAQCLELRVSEIMGLQCGDFDFKKRTVLVRRGVVQGHVDEVKTEYSKDHLPLDARLAEAVLARRSQTIFPRDEQWLFANPATARPYPEDGLQQRILKPAGTAAGIGDDIGWRTFHHTYRSWLDETGAPMKVQQELMRHAPSRPR